MRSALQPTALVTGASAGIGYEIAKALARQDFRVILHGRDRRRLEAAASAIAAGTGNAAIETALADFRSLDSVRTLAGDIAERTGHLDVLVNNAGLVLDRMELTRDGIETVFQVNHLATFLLTALLVDRLQAAPHARVVTVASRAHTRITGLNVHDLSHPARWSTVEAYARSKGCNILFTKELARRLAGTKVTATCLHPGVVRTRFALDGDVRPVFALLWRAIQPFMLSAEQGADTAVWLATDPAVHGRSGGYFSKRQEIAPRPYTTDAGLAAALWDLSESLCRLPATAPQPKVAERLVLAATGT